MKRLIENAYGFAQLLDESHWFSLQTSRSPPASTSHEEVDKLIGRHIEESIQIHASVTELFKRSLLRLSGSNISLNVHHGNFADVKMTDRR
nr:hypothetical protein T12_1993 [Ipomoea batatas]